MDKLLDPALAGVDLERFMCEALLEAEEAGKAGELSIGAVLVLDGQIIARGRARHEQMKSQISHAELNAMQNGGEPLWKDFRRVILFTSVEPCPMCLGAAVMADIPHIVFAKHDHNVHSGLTVETNPYVRRHIRSYCGGVLEHESTEILRRYNPEILKYIEKIED